MKLNLKKETAIVLALFILCVAFHLPSLNNEAWEYYDDWRQSDTYSIAQNYYRYSMNPFLALFNYDGAQPVPVQLELQIIPYISAVIFKLISDMTPLVPRVISLLFFIGSALYLYRVARRAMSFLPAASTLVLYLSMPITMLYSRAIMPESAALFFLNGAIYFLYDWHIADSKKSMWLSAVMTAFAIMEKTPTAFVGLLIIFVFFCKYGINALKKASFYIYGAISLGVPVLQLLYSGSTASSTFVSSIAEKHILTDKIFALFSEEAKVFFSASLPMYFGIPVLVAAALGLVCAVVKKKGFFYILALSFILETVTIVAIIKFGYYLIFMAPVSALLFGILIHSFTKLNKTLALVLAVFVIVATLFISVPLYKEKVTVNENIARVGEFIDQTLPENASIAFGIDNPVYINASNRCGFRANLNYYDFIPQGAQNEIEYFINHGIEYYIALNSWVYNDADGSYIDYIKDNFEVCASNELCTVYKLK